jgi:hypothetical protein
VRWTWHQQFIWHYSSQSKHSANFSVQGDGTGATYLVAASLGKNANMTTTAGDATTHSMIVSLILIILMVLIPFLLHLTVKLDKQIKRNEAILLRLDEKEKKHPYREGFGRSEWDPRPGYQAHIAQDGNAGQIPGS